MPIQDALDFFHLVRQRPYLQEQIATWGPAPSLSQLIELASQLGCAFSQAELHAAFRHDWTIRWLHHASAP
ncbi:MAG TPA: Nif11-like leader peptide family natural product precursor [Mycobacteriales bacterium]|nr:Nif11-like leader peptide family natural product precursor [Mycobacteriales bacterium]